MNADLFSFIFKRKASHLRPRTKIQQDADFDFCGTQIVQQLCFMRGIKGSASFQFHKNQAIDHQISVICSNDLAVEPNWNLHLTLARNSALFENERQRLLVDLLQESCSQFVVDLVEDADDLLS